MGGQARCTRKSIMKIGLIIPGSPFLGDEKRNCPLGILHVAAVLEKAGHDVFVADLRGVKNWKVCLPPAELYGIGTATADYYTALNIARFLRKCYNSHIVIGGYHATAVPQSIDEVFDDIIVGEGEIPMRLIANNEYSGYGMCPYRIGDIDTVPFPARHLLPKESVISDSLINGEPSTPMILSRGCPYKCSFCAAPTMWGRRVTYRSPENIRREIKHLVARYGIRGFRFQDDDIAVNFGRLADLCNMLKPLNVVWRASARTDSVNRPALEKMKEAGCVEIGYGIETICQETLDINNKNTRVEDMAKIIQATKDVGIHNRLYMIIGLPGEEKGIANRTIEFLQEADPHCVMLSTFVPYPGTDIFNHPEKYGVKIKHYDYEKYLSVIGLYEDERDTPFICEYDDWSDQELIDERAKIIEYIQAEGLDKAK